jgi:hypothetical protein
VPPGVVTAMGPSVAPTGTVAVICVPRFTVKLAGVPLKVTAVAPVRRVPVIVTEVPTGPLRGRNAATIGGSANAVSAPGTVTTRPDRSRTRPIRAERRLTELAT